MRIEGDSANLEAVLAAWKPPCMCIAFYAIFSTITIPATTAPLITHVMKSQKPNRDASVPSP